MHHQSSLERVETVKASSGRALIAARHSRNGLRSERFGQTTTALAAARYTHHPAGALLRNLHDI